jgi:hypothetical protein
MNLSLPFLACSTCQTNVKLGGGDAVGWSIFFLLVVIILVASSVIFFMARLAARSRRFALEEEAEFHNA